MRDYRTPLLLFLLAFVLITLFSCCSWIYPLQPHDDANWFMAIGKSMLSSKSLYTDVHDQKGPVLFFLHEWAASLSPKTFIGIYLVEVLCCFGFLLLSFKTMCLFANRSISFTTTCIVGVLTYSSDFMLYGDTVEELSLPVLLLILHKSLWYAKRKELPNDSESALIGAGVAAIFWMKFTVLAMCIGALAALFIIAWRRRQVSLLLQCLAWIVAGAGGLTACVLLYFVLHGNEADLYHSYFYFNIFLYTGAGKMDASAAWWLVKWTGWILLVGAVLFQRVTRDVKLIVTLCWGAELLTFVFLKVYLYYFLTIFVFAPLVVYYVRKIRSKTVIAAGVTMLTLFAVCTNYNFMTLITGNFPKAVLPLAETVNADKDPDKQVLTVKSYDTGIYTLTDCLPPIKYFSTPNAYLEELVTEQTNYLKSCKAKYLIMKTEKPIYYENFHPNLTRDYMLVQEESSAYRCEFLLHPLQFLCSLGYMKGLIETFCTPECQSVTYRLYRLKDTESSGFNAQGLIGEWKMCLEDSRSYFTLIFFKHNLIRCKEYEKGKIKMDKTYSYTFEDGNLKLGYMFTGEEHKTIKAIGQSDTKLVFKDWPRRGKCILEKQCGSE